jgi:hypothetical protein
MKVNIGGLVRCSFCIYGHLRCRAAWPSVVCKGRKVVDLKTQNTLKAAWCMFLRAEFPWLRLPGCISCTISQNVWPLLHVCVAAKCGCRQAANPPGRPSLHILHTLQIWFLLIL